MAQQIQIRRDGSTDWTAANPVLGQGEIGLELDTIQFKFGDGGTAWNNLPYYSPTDAVITWGTIVGTLSNQVDVQLALDAKQDAIADSDDITEGLVNLFLTTSERANLGNTSGINTGDQDLSSYATLTNLNDGLDAKQNVIVSSDDITEGSINLFLTTSERTILGNTSGTNTGDQDLSGKADLSGATFTGSISATNLSGTNTGDQDLSGYATTSALNLKADLSGATFTGAISATNLSGTNTGDQTSITGNAGTATALQTARSINGVSFNGTANITVADATKLPLAGGTLTGPILFPSAVINGVDTFCQSAKPIVRNNGSALVIGDRWYKSNDGTSWFWNGTYWVSTLQKKEDGLPGNYSASINLMVMSLASKYNTLVKDIRFGWHRISDSPTSNDYWDIAFTFHAVQPDNFSVTYTYRLNESSSSIGTTKGCQNTFSINSFFATTGVAPADFHKILVNLTRVGSPAVLRSPYIQIEYHDVQL